MRCLLDNHPHPCLNTHLVYLLSLFSFSFSELCTRYQRARLTNIASNSWGYRNWNAKLRFSVDAGCAGKTFSFGGARAYTVLAATPHANTSASSAEVSAFNANQVRSDNWQPLVIVVETIAPLPAPPKRLHTGFCWDSWSEFGPNSTTYTPDEIRMWGALGFNVVPSDGVSSPPDLGSQTALR
jgi:hypothetical protein